MTYNDNVLQCCLQPVDSSVSRFEKATQWEMAGSLESWPPISPTLINSISPLHDTTIYYMWFMHDSDTSSMFTELGIIFFWRLLLTLLGGEMWGVCSAFGADGTCVKNTARHWSIWQNNWLFSPCLALAFCMMNKSFVTCLVKFTVTHTLAVPRHCTGQRSCSAATRYESWSWVNEHQWANIFAHGDW